MNLWRIDKTAVSPSLNPHHKDFSDEHIFNAWFRLGELKTWLDPGLIGPTPQGLSVRWTKHGIPLEALLQKR